MIEARTIGITTAYIPSAKWTPLRDMPLHAGYRAGRQQLDSCTLYTRNPSGLLLRKKTTGDG